MSGKDQPLAYWVGMVIEVGVDALARMVVANGFVIVDNDQLAHDVSERLDHEKKDGSTPVTDLIDKAIVDASEDGSVAFEDME